MTEEQKKIKFVIDMFHAPMDYHDFETGEECLFFLQNRSKMMHANEADKIKANLLEFADKNSRDINAWISIFEEYSYAVKHDSTKPYTLFINLYKEKKIPLEVQFPLFMYIYVNSNVKYGYCKYFVESYINYPTDLKEKMRNELYNHIKDYADKDGNFTVYRGEYINANNGSSNKINKAISFTFNYDIALKFACRKSPDEAYVYITKVSFDNIIYFTDERDEKEVLVRPVNKGGEFLKLECNKVNPEDYYNKPNSK